MKKIFIPVLFAVITACQPKQGAKPPAGDSGNPQFQDTVQFARPKNIILMIGDGMGLTQITAGMYINGNKLNLEQFLYIGLHKTHASNNLVTDSAAGATAFSCGKKTYNGAIGLDKSKKPATTILEKAESEGMPTGLVVTSSITHATPASFYAHQKDRSMMDEIAADLLKSDVDFFVGGGKKHFDRRKDGQDLLPELAAKGYAISTFLDKEFSDITIDFNKKFGYFTADGEPLPVMQGRDYLVQACESAVTYLSGKDEKDKGFFLLVEGSQIDWGGHANDSEYIVREMIDFDNAIGKVLDFAKKDGETLVIVTADHETGGYAINPGSTMDSIVPAFTTDKHTAVLIPVFAYGPGAELFSGIFDNTAVYFKMMWAMGW